MKTPLKTLTCIPLILLPAAAMAEVPAVIADTAPVHSLVARVMGDLGAPEMLLPPGANPHDAALRPSDAARLSAADLVIWTGPGLVPQLQGPIETLAQGATVLRLLDSEGWERLPLRDDPAFETEGHDHHHGGAAPEGPAGHDHAEGEAHDHADHAGHDHAEGEDHDHADHAGHDHAEGEGHDHADHAGHDHAEGEDHDHADHAGHDHAEGEGHDQADHAGHDHAEGEGHDHADHAGHDHAEGEGHDHADHAGHDHGDGADPHAWLSPDVAAAWMRTIAAALAAADPENGETYAANAEAAIAADAALVASLRAELAPLSGRAYVVPHDAYQYFEHAFAMPATGAITLTDAAAPGPAHIAALRTRIADLGVACILTDPQTPEQLVRLVAEGMAVRTAMADPDGSSFDPGPDLYPALIAGVGAALVDCLSEG